MNNPRVSIVSLKKNKAMSSQDFTDYIELVRPEGKKVRVVFEVFQGEVLYYHYEYQHDENSEWKAMERNSNEINYMYTITDEQGNETEHTILFPTITEMKYAHEAIAPRNYGHSV